MDCVTKDCCKNIVDYKRKKFEWTQYYGLCEERLLQKYC